MRVDVMDMLRFDGSRLERYWVDDYGYPNKEAGFSKQAGLLLPQYRGTDYPLDRFRPRIPMDRVVSGHSFKYTARLQALDTVVSPSDPYRGPGRYGSGKRPTSLLRNISGY